MNARSLVKIPCVYMRGGTSKGLIINENDLPRDAKIRDQVILKIYGSPNPWQIDGIGGGSPTTSKLALVRKSEQEDIDIVYTFGQVSVTEEIIDYKPTCGNMAAAVGLYAVEEGFCKIKEPYTVVRIFNTNANKIIEVEVPVKNGAVVYDGDFSISGVPGTASKINVNFLDSGGAITGKVLPTGNIKDKVSLSSGKIVEVSVVDSANTIIFVKADQVDIEGTEVGKDFNKKELLDRLEEIRTIVGKQIGLISPNDNPSPFTHALPKICVIAKPRDYVSSEKQIISADDIHIIGRYLAMGTLHPAFAVSGAIALATASQIPGTVVHDMLVDHKGPIKIGHPTGIIEVEATVIEENGEYRVQRAAIGRTARRIMEGYSFVPASLFNGAVTRLEQD
ncbi:2-methylaconitate cis-trans isomerase PrpF family protein [Geobacillus thermoleovorans]|uniref:2-methylaconitate cis-trans isomerase PrpF family protein n=1 Tax=Geobacillus thermoleovorans TaxID=33941 RepID=UPI003D2013AE